MPHLAQVMIYDNSVDAVAGETIGRIGASPVVLRLVRADVFDIRTAGSQSTRCACANDVLLALYDAGVNGDSNPRFSGVETAVSPFPGNSGASAFLR